MNHFYIYLPIKFKGSSSSNFVTQIANRINLKGDWDIGMAGITYTKRWYNIRNDEIIKIKYFDNGKMTTDDVKLSKGSYHTIEELLESINNLFKNAEKINNIKYPRLNYVEESHRVVIKITIYKNTQVFPEFSKNLCEIIGINKNKLDSKAFSTLFEYAIECEQAYNMFGIEKSSWEPLSKQNVEYFIAENAYNISAGFNTLLVYCNLVYPSHVGDKYTQLLRSVEIPPVLKYGDQINIDYNHILYYSLLIKEFQIIELVIRDETGETIPFTHGECIVILHLKKRGYNRYN